MSERVDAVVTGGELGMALAEELAALAPFGCANPAVSLLVRGARFAERRPMGEGRHVRFTVLADGARARAVAFGSGTSLPVGDGKPADATFALEVNEWGGVSEPRLVLRHAQPAQAQGEAQAPDPADTQPEGLGRAASTPRPTRRSWSSSRSRAGPRQPLQPACRCPTL